MVNKEQVKMYAQRMFQGFLMGAASGLTVGLVVGGISVLTVGPAPGKSYMATVGKHMLQTAGFLGGVLSIGSVLRGDSQIDFPRHTPIRISNTKFQ